MVNNSDLEKVLKTFENMPMEEYEKLYKIAETREPLRAILDDLPNLLKKVKREQKFKTI